MRRFAWLSVAIVLLLGAGAPEAPRNAPATGGGRSPVRTARARRAALPSPPKQEPPVREPLHAPPVRDLRVTVQVLPPSATPAPRLFALEQNQPNPFVGATQIVYALPKSTRLTIKVYSLTGRRVATLVDTDQPAGRYAVQWDGSDDAGRSLGSGVYFYRFTAGAYSKSLKLVIDR